MAHPLTPTRDEYRKMVSDLVYHTLLSAGEICRIRCFTPGENSDPDLLDSIADGIHRFIADGDVFEQVIRTLVERDPHLFDRVTADMEEN